MTLLADDLITADAGKLGLFHEDGKVEFGFDGDRNIVLVDALGTPDECRFTYQGLPVSKEIARIYYRGTDWHSDVEEAKSLDKVNWKRLVKSAPQPIPGGLRDFISNLYKAYAGELTGRRWFDVPPLKESLQTIERFLQE